MYRTLKLLLIKGRFGFAAALIHSSTFTAELPPLLLLLLIQSKLGSCWPPTTVNFVLTVYFSLWNDFALTLLLFWLSLVSSRLTELVSQNVFMSILHRIQHCTSMHPQQCTNYVWRRSEEWFLRYSENIQTHRQTGSPCFVVNVPPPRLWLDSKCFSFCHGQSISIFTKSSSSLPDGN